jgi:lysophospholipase L1-like esterase
MKILLRLILIFSVLFLSAVGFVWYDYTSFENKNFVSPRVKSGMNINELNIGIIGESWAAGRKIDDYLISFMEESGFIVTVVSKGHPGAKSKLVYQDMFKIEGEESSSNHILYDEKIDICIILTGVNDTAAYVGSEFYSYHLKLIVDALITRRIIPLVVEIPEYGIEETDSRTIHGKIRKRLMRLIHDDNVVDVIPKYRSEARDALAPYISKNQIIYFPFQSVSDDYLLNRNLYKSDLLHLNAKGNEKLAFEISEVITKWLKNHNTRKL